MNVKYVAASVVALGTMVGSIVGIRDATGGTSDVAHATGPSPAVVATVLQVYPPSVAVSATGFTQGGRVHVELLVAHWYNDNTPSDSLATSTPTPRMLSAPTVVDSIDITAARTINVPNGHGIVFQRAGGYFTTALASSDPSCLDYKYWLVATDQTTGITVTGVPTEEDRVCF